MKNLEDSFSFVFKDPKWLRKVTIGAAFTFLSIFLLGIPVIYGYGVSILQRVRNGEKNPLPEWKDVGILFITGLKYLVTLFIYYLPLAMIAIPFCIFLIFSFTASATIISLIHSSLLILFFFIIIVLYSLFILVITPMISIQFAEKESIADGLQISKVFEIFKFYWKDALLIFLIYIILGILASIGIIFFLIGIFFTSFYVTVVRFHMYGQIGRSIQESLKP